MTGRHLDGPRQGRSGRYYGRAVINGQSRRVSLRTRHSAVAHARWQALVLDPEAYLAKQAERRASSEPIAKATTKYIADLRDVRRRRPRSVRRAEGVVLRFVAHVGDRSVASVTSEHVRTYLASRAVKPSTLRLERAILSAMFGWFVRRRIVRANPVLDVETTKAPRGANDLRRFPSSADLSRMSFAEESDAEFLRAYVRVLAGCGLRVSEADAMLPEHVHADTLHVPERKGGVGGAIPFPDGRTADAARIVAEANARWSRPIYERVLRAFGRGCERLGIGRMTLHALRHGCISRWVNEDRVPISVAQQWAGHSSPRMTEKYLHVDASQAPKPRALEW